MHAFRPALAFIATLALAAPAHGREATATVSACFTPAEACADRIVAALDGAQHVIRVQAYMFPAKPILAALVAAARRGVDVKIILDKTNDPEQISHYTGATFVLHAVWVDDRVTIAHNKVIVPLSRARPASWRRCQRSTLALSSSCPSGQLGWSLTCARSRTRRGRK